MLSTAQIKTLKMAQRQAGIGDDEYREHLGRFGVVSSKDPALGDDALDVILSLFEAIYWRGVKEGRLQAPCNRREIFRQEGYWASKNPSGNTSRDRYTGTGLHAEIARLESSLYQSGCGINYVAAIRNRVCRGIYTPPQQRAYLAALQRTLAARQRKHSTTASADPVW